jgi:Tol biopolymer transport system component
MVRVRSLLRSSVLFPVASLTLVWGCSSGGGDGGGQLAAPLLAGYSENPASYLVGEAIEPNLPQVTGVADDWSIDPALPGGLTLDPDTGAITGVPQAAAALTSYTVTAANADASAELALELEVLVPVDSITVLASQSGAGAAGNNSSNLPAVSGNGELIAFQSFANNLVAGDTNGQADIFVRDLDSGATQRVSLANGGVQADNSSGGAVLDQDGDFVAYESFATNLVAGDTNGQSDVFRTALSPALGVLETVRVSVSSAGVQGNGASSQASISGAGDRVVFASLATNLVVGDTNGASDIFLRVLGAGTSGTTERVSVSSAELQANGLCIAPRISADGNAVVFASTATNLVPGVTTGELLIYVRDLDAGTTECVSVSSEGFPANGPCSAAQISPNGRFVAFGSSADLLVAGDNNLVEDVFLHDREQGTTVRVSVSSTGEQGNGQSRFPALSADGDCVFFDSLATNLVPDDTNGVRDIFRHEVGQETQRVNLAADGTQADLQAFFPAAAPSGETVAYVSAATNLVEGVAGQQQVFASLSLLVLSAAAGPDSAGVFQVQDGRSSGELTRRVALGSRVGGADPSTLRLELVPQVPWLAVQLVAEESGSEAVGEVELQFLGGGLPAGVHRTELWVRGPADGSAEPLARLPVALRVTD